jgi:hypothetical protein
MERRRGHAEAVRDLGYADVGIGQHRLGGLNVVVGEFRRTVSLATKPTCRGKARSGALADQAALEFREVRQTCEKPAAPVRSWCRGLRSGREIQCLSTIEVDPAHPQSGQLLTPDAQSRRFP